MSSRPLKVETDLTQGPLWRRFWDLAVPGAIGILFTTLYNIVDVYFAGLISTQAQAGLAIAFQPFFLLVTFGIGLGTAMSALVGNAYGSGERDQARCLAFQGMAFALAGAFVLIAIGMLLTPKILLLTSEPGAYREAGQRYFNVLVFALPGFVVAFAINGVLQALGDAVSMQRALIAAFFANLALNPLMVFGIPGLWSGLGFDGIAVATVISQTGVAAFLIWRAAGKALLAKPIASEFRLTVGGLREIVRQQAPSSSSMLVMIAAGLVIQFYLKSFGQSAVAAYGVALRVEQLFLLPAFGLTGALLPIAAQNFGAGKTWRVRRALWVCIAIGLAYMAIACPVLWFAAPQIMAVFADDPDVARIGVSYLRVDGVILPAYMTLFAINAHLQALKKPQWAFWIGVYRQTIAVPLFIWVFVGLLGFDVIGVWFGIATAVLTGLLLSAALAHMVSRPLIGPLFALGNRRTFAQ